MNDALGDRLVCGILQESIQKRLLSEADLTFKRAVEIAVAVETAARDAVELRSGAKMSVNKMFTVSKAKKMMQTSVMCYRCNKGGQCNNATKLDTDKEHVDLMYGTVRKTDSTTFRKKKQGCACYCSAFR